MKSTANTVFLLLSALFAFTNESFALITRIEPEKPRWGETLTIVYDTTAPGSKFTSGDEVYVTARLLFPGHSEDIRAKMAKEGHLFKYRLNLRNNLSAVNIHFITLGGGWDESAYMATMIYRDDGKAARGAYESKIGSRRYQEFFEQEMALYPDNYSAYRTKWSVAHSIEGKNIEWMVNPEMKKLASVRGETPELLGVLSYGYLLLGREEQSCEMIRRLFEKFPDSNYTAQAIRDYESETGDSSMKNRVGEVATIKLEILRRYPETEYSRSVSIAMAQDQRAPLDLIEIIARRWMESEPENPQPYLTLAKACKNQYQKYDLASHHVEKAIGLLLEGRLRLYGDLDGKQTTAMLADAYLTGGDLAFRQNRYERALSSVKTSQSFESVAGFAAQLLEANIWQTLSQESRAETAFIEAWRRGSREAEDRLRSRYLARFGNLQGFDEYLVSAGGKSSTNLAGGMAKRPSPRFRLTSLRGKTFDLNDLQGKIVVLDLWFIACGPCRQEIPHLNKLVSEFKNSNVVFIAPSLDRPGPLKEFLKGLPFDYHVVPNAEELIMRKFNAPSFPTHIIIDQDGQIDSMLVGGDERRPEEVRLAILRLLSSQTSQR